MIECTLVVSNRLGLHARASAKLVSIAARYDSDITITHERHTVDARNIMGLLTLGAAKGTPLLFRIDGPDESTVQQELDTLFANRFDEED